MEMKTAFSLRFHEGYKGRQIPRAVIIGDREIAIAEISGCGRIRDRDTGQSWEAYRCRLETQIPDDWIDLRVFPDGRFEIRFRKN